MSLNSNAERVVGASGSRGLSHEVPKLTAGAGGYARWRPLMENVLLRSGVATRDYAVLNPDWVALVSAVDRWAIDGEAVSIAHALAGAGIASSSSAKKSASVSGPDVAEKEARRGAVDAVGRTRLAYGLLHHALPDDLRRLVAHITQGDAWSLWSWLEKRFQSTEQDNIGDLWDQFTALKMEDGGDHTALGAGASTGTGTTEYGSGMAESFDQYKARVDHVYGLLAHAKDKPSAGQYAHRLLWKLAPRFNAAVLAMKMSGLLKDADKIDWSEVVVLMNNHERAEFKLSADQEHDAVMAVRAPPGWMAKIECFNCGKFGHMSRNCQKPAPPRRPRLGGANDEHDDDDDDEVSGISADGSGHGVGTGAGSGTRLSASYGRRGGSTVAKTPRHDEKSERRPGVVNAVTRDVPKWHHGTRIDWGLGY